GTRSGYCGKMLQRSSSTRSFAPSQAESGYDVHELLNFLWREWKFIASFVGIALLLGVVGLARATPRYTAGADILLEPRKDKPVGSETFSSDTTLDSAAIASQLAIIRSSMLLQRVVEREDLVNDPEFGTARTPKTDSQSFPAIFSRLYAAFRPQENAEPHGKIRQPTASDITNSVESLKGAVGVNRAGQAY